MEICKGFEPGSNLPFDVCRLCGKSRLEHPKDEGERTAMHALQKEHEQHVAELHQELDRLEQELAQSRPGDPNAGNAAQTAGTLNKWQRKKAAQQEQTHAAG